MRKKPHRDSSALAILGVLAACAAVLLALVAAGAPPAALPGVASVIAAIGIAAARFRT